MRGTVGSGGAGVGYAVFFALTTALALPALALLPLIKPRIRTEPPLPGESLLDHE
jgi:hypothetical protein